MMPCKLCSCIHGSHARGLKQVGKTRYAGPRFVRKYRCQDCGATLVCSGDLHDAPTDVWIAPDSSPLTARRSDRAATTSRTTR